MSHLDIARIHRTRGDKITLTFPIDGLTAAQVASAAFTLGPITRTTGQIDTEDVEGTLHATVTLEPADTMQFTANRDYTGQLRIVTADGAQTVAKLRAQFAERLTPAD